MLKLVLMCILLALCLTFASCGGESATAASSERARTFDEFPVVWLGDEYKPEGYDDALPLVDASYTIAPAGRYHPEVASFGLVYGKCEIKPGRSSCTVPVQIDVYGACEAPELADEAKAGGETVRGVDVVVQSDGGLWIETDQFTVSIKSALPLRDDGTRVDDTENNLRIAQALVGANQAAAGITRDSTFAEKSGDQCEPEH
jgi:hypothetical protein